MLHIAPGDSAGGTLRVAIRDAGRDDEVLAFRDDLSCGPIEPDDAATRAAWWAQWYDRPEVEEDLAAFWRRVGGYDGRIVVWFGRHSASEMAFSLAWADRMQDRAYWIVDVTGRRLPRRRDGSMDLSRPVGTVSILQPEMLRSLLDAEQSATAEYIAQSSECWQRLRRENAPFRIVTEAGLASAAIDCFDDGILAQAKTGWRKIARVVAEATGYNSEPYIQVGDLMLLTRVAALVEQGRLVADGDPWSFSSSVRLPDASTTAIPNNPQRRKRHADL